MLKVNKDTQSDETKITLSISGWIALLVIMVSLITGFVETQIKIVSTKENIEFLKTAKLDKYEYMRDVQVNQLRDSTANAKLDKIMKKLGID